MKGSEMDTSCSTHTNLIPVVKGYEMSQSLNGLHLMVPLCRPIIVMVFNTYNL